jgi:hypothetical protein
MVVVEMNRIKHALKEVGYVIVAIPIRCAYYFAKGMFPADFKRLEEWKK